MRFFLLFFLFFSPLCASLSQDIAQQVYETIECAREIPGLNCEQFASLETDLRNTCEYLFAKGFLECSGPDEQVRPHFVAVQAIMEHVLASLLPDEIKEVVGIIHTPMPTTPLCMKEKISPHLVARQVELDPQALFTVKSRATILRDYLKKGAELYVVYPCEGLSKRTRSQQKIYLSEIALYPELLIDLPLRCSQMPYDMIGATYLFKDHDECSYLFSIQMTQANDPKENGCYGLWFGPLSDPKIAARSAKILTFIQKNTL